MSSGVVKVPPGCMVLGCRLPGCFCALLRLIRPSVRHSRRATRGKGTDQASLASDLAITIFSAQTLTVLIRPLSIPLKSACDRLSERFHKLMADLIVIHSLMGA